MKNPDSIFGRMGNRMFQGAYIYAQMKKGKIPDIYVQDCSYFDKYEEEIKNLYGDGVGFLPYVGIHVRRGDYVGNPFYVDLSKTDYYEKAIAMFPNKVFLVFSDDKEFAKKMFSDTDKFQVMENENELEDFNQLASCSSQIIANSSFSWWAAYVNPNFSKRVIAPSDKNWFSDGKQRVVCPKSWIRI